MRRGRGKRYVTGPHMRALLKRLARQGIAPLSPVATTRISSDGPHEKENEPMTEYRIVSAASADALSAGVNELLAAGFQLVGQPSVANMTMADAQVRALYAQALVRESARRRATRAKKQRRR